MHGSASGTLNRFLHSKYAPFLTHISLILLTVAFFGLLLQAPYWLAFLPCVVLGHRIGVLLHEYFHGIPFRQYRHNLVVATLWDAFLMFFGMLELFRGTHLAHHKWLNTELDGARETSERTGKSRLRDVIAGLEAVQQLTYLWDALRGRKPYIRGHRLLLGFVLSALAVWFWVSIGHGEIVWKVLGVSAFTTLVPISLRGAIEHHSHRGDPGFANEYRVWIPLFNLNRHVHHHEEPTVPWYLLEYRTQNPLHEWNYVTHWVNVYLRREFVLMQPMRKTPRREMPIEP